MTENEKKFLAAVGKVARECFGACDHEYEHFRNIHGDEINAVSLKKVYRSWWHCKKCGKWQAREKLVKPERA